MQAVEPGAVACTLDAVDIGPRLARLRRLTRDHLRSHHLFGSTLSLVYGRDAATEVASIVALERQCCAFLEYRLTETAEAVELVIAGPEQAGSDAQWLFAQFLPETQMPAPDSNCSCCRG